MKSYVALAAVIVATAAASQTPAPTAPNSLLDQIQTQAATYRAILPSLTADESITSQSNGLFKQHAEARALFRVVRQSSGAPFTESRQIVELNGKPVPVNHEPHLPLTFQGAFGDALELFFAPAVRRCFDFNLTTAEPAQLIRFTMRSGAEADPACAHTPPGVSGFALVDPATRQIQHLERTVPDAVATPRKIAGFVAIDYAATPVGEQSLWLPSRIVARTPGGQASFTATYSNYHRFTGTVTLLPSVTPVDPPPS